MSCWVNNSRYKSKYQIYDNTTVLRIEVSCVKIGTDCLFINRCLGKPILKKR